MTGKNIEIKIAATGGDKAAQEIQKVVDATGGLADATGKIPSASDEAGSGLDDLRENLRDMRQRAEETAGGFRELGQQLGDEAAADTRGSSLLGGLRNAGRGVRGLAAGLGGRGPLSRAATALAGGPITLLTAAIGVTVAALARWKRALDDWRNSQDENATAYQDFTQEVIRGRRELETANRVQEESAQRARDFEQAQFQAFRAQFDVNQALRENISLLKEKQTAENEIAAARGRAEIEEAADDPVRQEEIRNRLRQEAQEREIRQIEEDAREKQDLLNRLEEQQARAQDAGTQLAENLQQQATAAREEAQALEELARSYRRTAEEAKAFSEDESNPFADRRIAARTAGKVSRRADDVENRLQSTQAAAESLAAQAEAARQQVETEVTGILAEMNRLFQELQKLERTRETRTAVFTEEDRTGDSRLGRVRQQAEERAREEQQKRQREEEKQRLKAERERQQSRLSEQAGTAADQFTRDSARGQQAGLDRSVTRTLGSIAQRLADGTNEAELARIEQQFAQATQGMGGSTIAALEKMISGMQDQAKKIEVLESRIRNIR